MREHARVHLADRAEGACDYINASHVQASRSYKRYIASQGPLPATFDVSKVNINSRSSRANANCFPGFLVRDLGSRCPCHRHVNRGIGGRPTQMSPILAEQGIRAHQAEALIREENIT